MDKLTAWLSQLRFEGLLQTIMTVAASLLCITIHETCHGYMAYRLGDPTAKRMGRLTLNPLRHIDLVGLIMMAVAHFGWAKPVPVDMRYFKRPKWGMALTALAGPVSNVLLTWAAMLFYYAFFAVSLLKPGAAWDYVLLFFQCLALISAGLAVFNVFPIPPLDGAKVLFALLPSAWYEKLMRIERYFMLLLVVLLLTGVLDAPLLFLRNGLLTGLEKLSQWPFALIVRLFA